MYIGTPGWLTFMRYHAGLGCEAIHEGVVLLTRQPSPIGQTAVSHTWRSHVAKYRSLMPSLALIGHLIDGVAGGPTGPVSGAAAARAVAWCAYLGARAAPLRERDRPGAGGGRAAGGPAYARPAAQPVHGPRRVPERVDGPDVNPNPSLLRRRLLLLARRWSDGRLLLGMGAGRTWESAKPIEEQ